MLLDYVKYDLQYVSMTKSTDLCSLNIDLLVAPSAVVVHPREVDKPASVQWLPLDDRPRLPE